MSPEEKERLEREVTRDGPPAPVEAPPAGGARESQPGPKPPKDPAFYRRRKKRDSHLLCQVLIRHGRLEPKQVRRALKIQEEQGGQIGRILVRAGYVSENALARALLEQLRARAKEGARSASIAARESPKIAGLKVRCSPLWTTSALVAADVTSLFVGVLAGQSLNAQVVGAHRLLHLELAMPLAGVSITFCLLAFWIFGLYDAMAKSPPDELRDMVTAITLMFLSDGAVTFLHVGRHTWAWPALVTSWLVSVFIVPLTRVIVRDRCAHRPWWGHPVVVLGAAKTGRLLVRTLREHPRCGLKPVVVLDDDRHKHGTLRADLKDDVVEIGSVTQASTELVTRSLRSVSDLINDSARQSSSDLLAAPAVLPEPSGGLKVERARGQFAEVEQIPVVGKLELAPVLAGRLKIPYAIVAMPGVPSEKLLSLADRVGGVFSHLLIIPDLFGFASLGVPARDVSGILGIEVRQQLLLPWPRFAKRVMDVALTTVGGLCILPLLVLLTILVKLDSRGPAFYHQPRLGQDGRRFRAYKFRSMHGDGEARLKAVLDADPRLRAEYEEFHKLSVDPRVTRVGRFLRKYSLDELPQLYSVLLGDMSLVGPRPYLEREIPDMEQKEKIILRAPPGLTGLWQVSDRNATGFDVRIKTDVHYVRNWSPWLDIYVLARTFGVVIRGTGS